MYPGKHVSSLPGQAVVLKFFVLVILSDCKDPRKGIYPQRYHQSFSQTSEASDRFTSDTLWYKLWVEENVKYEKSTQKQIRGLFRLMFRYARMNVVMMIVP